jgi:hypothetical protein
MRSQLRFVMHAEDEREFVANVLGEASIVLIDGPRWPTNHPQSHRSLDYIGSYCILWSTADVPQLDSEFIPSCGDWYCRSEGSTIQFLRSQLLDSFLTDGRISVATDNEPPEVAQSVERRYRRLSRFIKQRYKNRVLRWRNPNAPQHSKIDGRSANPSDPDASLWLGPSAFAWLAAGRGRCVKQGKSSLILAELLPESQR